MTKADNLAYDYFFYLNECMTLYKESLPIGVQRTLTRKINKIRKQCLQEGLDFTKVMTRADNIFTYNSFEYDIDKI